MFYADEFIEQVRSESDIVDIISSYVSLKKKGSNWMACCPFHHEKTPSFSVNKENCCHPYPQVTRVTRVTRVTTGGEGDKGDDN